MITEALLSCSRCCPNSPHFRHRIRSSLRIAVAFDRARSDDRVAHLVGMLLVGRDERIAHDQTRRQRVDPNALFAEIAGERSGEAKHCAFRRYIVRHVSDGR